ncbi:MAG: DUF3078 domain-containing protein [Alistipes sp.]|nr:DUF3078 domain-containing protein [Alistipes sp.]
MRRFLLLAIFAVLFSVNETFAQFNVEKNKTATNEEQDIRFKETFKGMTVKTDYYNEARAKAERRNLRKQRNTVTMNFNLQGQMFAYNDAWGGENSTTVLGTYHFRHAFGKNKFAITTEADVRYGYNRARAEVTEVNADGEEVTVRKGIWFKNTDAFWVQTQPSLRVNERWAYTFTGRMDSRLSNTYASRVRQEKEHLQQSFLAPATVSASLGMTYSMKKLPLSITMSVFSASGTLVYSDALKKLYEERGADNYFGVEIDKHATFSGGSQIQLQFSKAWGKKQWISYWMNTVSYYGWITNVMKAPKIRAYERYLDQKAAWEAGGQQGDAPAGAPYAARLHPTVNSQHRITIKVSNLLSTNFYYQLVYDKAANTAVRTQSQWTVGMTYNWSNK